MHAIQLFVVVALFYVVSAYISKDAAGLNLDPIKDSDSFAPKVRAARHSPPYGGGGMTADYVRGLCEGYYASSGGESYGNYGQGRGHINNYGGSGWGGHGRRK